MSNNVSSTLKEPDRVENKLISYNAEERNGSIFWRAEGSLKEESLFLVQTHIPLLAISVLQSFVCLKVKLNIIVVDLWVRIRLLNPNKTEI